MKHLSFAFLVLFHAIQPAFAQDLQSEVRAEVEARFRKSASVGEFVSEITPSLPPTWSTFLSEKAAAVKEGKFTLRTRGPGSYTLVVGHDLLAFEIVDLAEGAFRINHKPYRLDTSKPPAQIWEEVAALLPQAQTKGAALEWLLPRANAIALQAAGFLTMWLVGVVGGMLLFQETNVDKFCKSMNKIVIASCNTMDPSEMATAVTTYFQMSHTRGMKCQGEDKGRFCVTNMLRSGKVDTAHLPPAVRSYAAGLMNPAPATAEASDTSK